MCLEQIAVRPHLRSTAALTVLRPEFEKIRNNRVKRQYTNASTERWNRCASRRRATSQGTQEFPSTESNVTRDATSIDMPPSKYLGKKAVVIGAGPAGITAAAYLAKNGFTVEVYDGRPDLTLDAPDYERAIGVILGSLTTATLRTLGIDLPSPESGFVNGLHHEKGTAVITSDDDFLVFSRERSQSIMGSRYDITCGIMNGVRRNYASRVTFHFEQLCTRVLFDEKTTVFREIGGGEYSVAYDLLVAADGINSTVRKELEVIDEELETEIYRSFTSYKSIHSLDSPLSNSKYTRAAEPGRFVFPPNRATDGKWKEFTGSFVYRVTQDGTFHAVISARNEVFQEIEGREDEWLLATLPDDFPEEWKKQICERFRSTPARPTPCIFRISKLIGPQTVFIGDAAHTVPIGLGLGCNMAIQDGPALNTSLVHGGGDIDKALEHFNSYRYKEIRQIQRVEEMFSGARIELSAMLFIPHKLFSLHIALYLLTNRLFPKWIPAHPAIELFEDLTKANEVIGIVKRDYAIVLALIVFGIMFSLRNVTGL